MMNMMGMVALSDTAAQKRCYEYLKKAYEIADTKSKEDTEDAQLFKNQREIIGSTVRLLEPSAGSHFEKKTHMFWTYWDKVRESAVKIVEGQMPGDEVYNKLEELEHGRARK
uniref:ARAD1A09284p n=1 Tax=Blastobotrys adeninivorans TaxID=409370 RepID=A0A060SXG5_BLAAD